MNEETLLPPRLASGDESFQRNYSALASKIVEFGDLADDNGLGEYSDKVASILPRLAILKVAQYEGFTNYWIANGRAFERAYKEKASKPGASPHEAWWAVLEEFQDSLGGNQAQFNEKYAIKNSDDQVSRHLVEAIVSRVEQHGSPSVAFYQAVHDVSTGKTLMSAAAELSGILAEAKKNDKLALVSEELETALDLAIRTAGVMDWMGRGVNWLGKAFDPIAEGVERFEMGAMGSGGPIVDAALKIRQQAEKIHEVIGWARTGDTTKTGLADFGVSMLGPIKKHINLLAMFAKQAGVQIPTYEDLCSHLAGGKGLTAGNVDEFAATFAPVFKLTHNQALLQKMYQTHLKKQKAIKTRNKPSTRPAPATAPRPGEAAAPAPAVLGPGEVDVGPEFVGTFMGAVQSIKDLSPKQFNVLRSLLNQNLMRSKHLKRPQLVQHPRAAAESQWEIKTAAAVNVQTLIDSVLRGYEALSGKPLLDDKQKEALVKALASPAAAAPAATAPSPAAAPAAKAPGFQAGQRVMLERLHKQEPATVVDANPSVVKVTLDSKPNISFPVSPMQLRPMTTEEMTAHVPPAKKAPEAAPAAKAPAAPQAGQPEGMQEATEEDFRAQQLAAIKDRIANKVLEGLKTLSDEQMAQLREGASANLASVKRLMMFKQNPTPENASKMKEFVMEFIRHTGLEQVLNNPEEVSKILTSFGAGKNSPVVKIICSIMSDILVPKQEAPADVAKKAPA